MNKYEQIIFNETSKIVEKENLEIFSVEEVLENGIKIIRVLIDKDTEIDIDDVTKVIEQLQEVVERDDLIPDEYYLEVSSVGIERPLRNIDEFKKYLSNYAYIEFKNPIESSLDWYGTLINVTEEEIEFEINKKGRIKKIKFPYSNVKKARIAIKF